MPHMLLPRVRRQCFYFSRALIHLVVDFGQGCNIAIEDGEALGYFLRDLTSVAQIPAALESFEAIRIPRAHMVQFASRQVGGLLSEEERKKAGQ
jgi:salicylate hydroxylase